MKTKEIKPFLSETVVADLMQAVQSKSTRLAATCSDDLYSTLEQRRAALGGMLGTRPGLGRVASGARLGSPHGRSAPPDGSPLRGHSLLSRWAGTSRPSGLLRERLKGQSLAAVPRAPQTLCHVLRRHSTMPPERTPLGADRASGITVVRVQKRTSGSRGVL